MQTDVLQLLEPVLHSPLQQLTGASGFHPSLPLTATHLGCEGEGEEGGDTKTSRSSLCGHPQLWDEVGLSQPRLWDKPCRCCLTPSLTAAVQGTLSWAPSLAQGCAGARLWPPSVAGSGLLPTALGPSMRGCSSSRTKRRTGLYPHSCFRY